jgi:hypothetical protein
LCGDVAKDPASCLLCLLCLRRPAALLHRHCCLLPLLSKAASPRFNARTHHELFESQLLACRKTSPHTSWTSWNQRQKTNRRNGAPPGSPMSSQVPKSWKSRFDAGFASNSRPLSERGQPDFGSSLASASLLLVPLGAVVPSRLRDSETQRLRD